MTRFEVGIPLGDINSNYVETTALQESMEAIALDGTSHNNGQDTRYKAGTNLDQCSLWRWEINDADLTTAQNNYTTFIAGYTFSNSPYMHSYVIA